MSKKLRWIRPTMLWQMKTKNLLLSLVEDSFISLSLNMRSLCVSGLQTRSSGLL